MSHIPKLLHALGRLLSYPDESTVQTAELLFVVLKGELDEAAQDAARFGAYAERHDLAELEEAFTRTFDVNPMSALEVGWHLFGEEYARGMFLVRMREELRKYAIPESVELPDHLSHVLSIVSAMPDEEAKRFVRACVQPAVEKMKQALAEKETPYRNVIDCLSTILKHVWGEPSSTNAEVGSGNRPFASDPLHAFPVADVTCGCGSSCSSSDRPDLLQIDLPLETLPVLSTSSIPARMP